MTIKIIEEEFSVCKVTDRRELNLDAKYVFLGKTDEEISCVCDTKNIPQKYTDLEQGWKMLKIEGILDFSLIGILSKISTILAEENIGIFVVSTYNTDYILIKKENLEKAVKALKQAKYKIV